MTVCQRLGAMVASWTVAGVLGIINTIEPGQSARILPWILVSLSAGITFSVSLTVWHAQANTTAEVRRVWDREDERDFRVVR